MAEIKIQIEGYEGIDEEKSNLSAGIIVLKRKEPIPWRKTLHNISGFYVADNSDIRSLGCVCNHGVNKNLFATKKQAKSMLAMAQLSQIIQNDERFGGPITDEEWNQSEVHKYCLIRFKNTIRKDVLWGCYHFLAFHTKEQLDLFLKENEDLIRQYYMLD